VVAVSDVNGQRIFEVDSSSILSPDNCWSFYQDGTMIPSDRDQFLKEKLDGDCDREKALRILGNYETSAVEEIAEILKAEAEWQPETEAERKARWIKDQQEETKQYLSRTADLKEALHNRMNN
jgi:hypothetical protein